MNITLKISDELLKEANGDLTITLKLEKGKVVESSQPTLAERVISKAQSFLSGDKSNSKSGLTFNELNNL